MEQKEVNARFQEYFGSTNSSMLLVLKGDAILQLAFELYELNLA